MSEVVFEGGVIAEEDAILSIAAQTITGTLVDQDLQAAKKIISAPQATAAGTVEIEFEEPEEEEEEEE